MITYKWKFVTIECAPVEDSLTDVVKTIHWTITASEPKNFAESTIDSSTEFYSATSVGCTSFNFVTGSGNFIPFEQLTTGTLANWIISNDNITGENGIYSYLEQEINNQKIPKTINKQII